MLPWTRRECGMALLDWRTDGITGEIVDAAVQVHRRMGPGLLESVYQKALTLELQRRGLRVERQKTVPFVFDGVRYDEGLRLDLLIEGEVVVEVKAVEALAPVYWRQVLTYLRLLHLPVGLLINFGGATLKEGLRRIVNDYPPAETRRPPQGTAPMLHDRSVRHGPAGDGSAPEDAPVADDAPTAADARESRTPA